MNPFRSSARLVLFSLLLVPSMPGARADDGYRLWLRYDLISDEELRAGYARELREVVLAAPGIAESPTVAAARDELTAGLRGLLGRDARVTLDSSPSHDESLGAEGHRIEGGRRDDHAAVVVRANTEIGALYGSFALLRMVQTGEPLAGIHDSDTPRIERRILNHWDNLNRFVERGYAGFSLWEWFQLPDHRAPRYRDYARACASVGINGAVLTNVNADALVLTAPYIEKVAALADEFRPYGVRVYLTARFSAPMEIGGLETADPLDPEVAAWWKRKVDEIYARVPDFGGFLVKANSEGQPGPQNFGRTHAEGANLLADALAPRDGIVMWRAFVYAAEDAEDRVKQAYSEFHPLDGAFRDNVLVQIKNGPLDFMPREPFHPLFGAMPRTGLALELQITQEYLGASIHLAYLAPMWKEVLDADTFTSGPGTTVARVIAGDVRADAGKRKTPTVIAGVANTGTDRNWTGHPLAQANWHAFGRLAWDYSLSSAKIADEWARMTFNRADDAARRAITDILLGSRETVVSYSMPLGLHHIMAWDHHYGPGPWVDIGRADWTSPYYHQADAEGLGAARSASGSNALEQYAGPLRKLWGDPETCPEELLLWFHHVPWDHRMQSGRTLWDELCLAYQRGVDEARAMVEKWETLSGAIDAGRHTHTKALLARQEREAREWRDACTLYFQQFSKRPLPEGVEPPAYPLEHYKAIDLRYVPGTPSGR